MNYRHERQGRHAYADDHDRTRAEDEDHPDLGKRTLVELEYGRYGVQRKPGARVPSAPRAPIDLSIWDAVDHAAPPSGGAAAAFHGLVQQVGAVQRKLAAEYAADTEAIGDVQQRGGGNDQDAGDVQRAAAHGLSGAGGSLPFLDQIQRAFGAHDISNVKAHTDSAAAAGAKAMGAEAYATGDRVAFAGTPSLHTAAHEAAHIVQQRAGVHLKGGVGAAGDAYEQHADAVADRVVQGKSAVDLLDAFAPRGGSSTDAVQRKEHGKAAKVTTRAVRTSGRPDEGAGRDGSPSVPAALTDPMLVPETRALVFPKTLVGETSVRTIVVRNDDARPIALDAVVAVRATTSPKASTGPADVFHEVAALLRETLLFAPDERREITIQFRPARAARIAQTLELVTGFGPVGPHGDIHVSGEGMDLPYSGDRAAQRPDATSSSAATEVRLDEQKREVADHARTRDALAKPRARATQLVDQWRVAAARYTHSLAQWTLANWIDFLGKTGGDHVLYGSAAAAESWKKIVATKLSSKLLKKGGRAAVAVAKRSAQVALVLEYPLFSQAIELAIDRLADFVLDKVGLEEESAKSKSDRHALAATQSTSAAGVQKTDEIFEYEARANLAIEDTSSGAQLRIADAETAEELARWAAWAQAERASLPPLVDPRDRELSNELLQRWVLEHAGTTQKANASTNPEAWNAARAELTADGKPDPLERRDLFAHQCRHEWGYLGLVGIEQAVAEIEAAMSQRDRLVTFTRTTNPRHLAQALCKRNYQLEPEMYGLRVFGGEFALDCNVYLERNHPGGVYVTQFVYTARGAGHQSGIVRRVPGAS